MPTTLQETELQAAGRRIETTRHEEGWVRTVARDTEQLPLTSREAEVLGLVAAGLQGAAIARQLVVSPATIKSHVQNTMTKLGARTRAHAVAIALRTGQMDADASPR